MYISVSDLKNYAYCPYIIFIKKVLNIGDIVTEYMLYGKEIEKDRILLSIYRYVKGVKILRSIMLVSKRFSITGCVDCIIIDKYRQYIPVDIKWCEDDKPRIDHKVQICAYAFMIEENFNTLCKFGILYYVSRSGGRLHRVYISQSLRNLTVKFIEDVKKILTYSEPPKHIPRRDRCRTCPYFQYCNFKL